jgi:hypothetical protein
LPRGHDLGGQGTFVSLAVGEKGPGGDGGIQVKTDVDLGFLGPVPIVGPLHGEDGIDQRSVNADQIPQLLMFWREDRRGSLVEEGLKDWGEWFQASGVDNFEKAVF